MTTIDNLLTKLATHTEPTIEDSIPKRDARVLRSLATAVTGPLFITENQSKLLLKILHENSKKLNFLGEEFSLALAQPMWSRVFRPVDKTKKMFIGKNPDDGPAIVLEFAFSSQIRKILANLNKITDGPIMGINNRIHQCDLTEKNIVLLVEALKPEGFDIHEDLQNHYDTIKSWNEADFKNQFLITNVCLDNSDTKNNYLTRVSPVKVSSEPSLLLSHLTFYFSN